MLLIVSCDSFGEKRFFTNEMNQMTNSFASKFLKRIEFRFLRV